MLYYIRYTIYTTIYDILYCTVLYYRLIQPTRSAKEYGIYTSTYISDDIYTLLIDILNTTLAGSAGSKQISAKFLLTEILLYNM